MSYEYKEKIALWEWYDSPEVTSTNDEVKNLLAKTNLVVLSAEKQSGGRGRRGRKWQGVSGNLYFTYTYQIPTQDLSKYVCLIGLSLAKTVQEIVQSADIQIKWPNDVFLNGGKLSGILLENISENLWAIGIGVNIVGAPEIANNRYKAASLSENGVFISRIDFLKKYLEIFMTDSAQYIKEGFETIRKKWLDYAMNLGSVVTIKNEAHEKQGIFLTLDDSGYIVLKTEQGIERIIAGDLFT